MIIPNRSLTLEEGASKDKYWWVKSRALLKDKKKNMKMKIEEKKM